MQNPSFKQEALEKYDKLQTEYKNLFAKYNEIKNKNPHSVQLEQTVKELDSKHKAIKELMEKIY